MIRKYIFGFLMAILATTSLCVGGGICDSLSNPNITYADSEISAKSTSSGRFELKYDGDKQYFYFEDGYYPQSYVGNSLNTTLNSAGLSVQYSLTVAGNLYGVYAYNNEEYLKLTAPKSVSVSLDGTSVNFVAGSFYWFKLEPIRWRLSDFGVAESERDKIIPSSRVEDIVKAAVSDVVLDWGAIASGSVSEGWKYSDSAQYLTYNTNFGNESCQINFAAEVEREFDYFNADGTNIAVKSENITTSGVYQVSQSELNENFTSKVAYASDLVCMMAGISDTQYCDYWTRDLTTLNNGTYITSTGIARNRYLTSSCGVRLSYSVLAPANVAMLKTGQELNALMKNATYTTQNTTIQTITFDYFTNGTVGNYVVAGTNVIDGLSCVDGGQTEEQIYIYGAGTANVYVLSNAKMFLPTDGSYCFSDFRALTNIAFNNYDTANVTNMEGMFYNCGYSATSLSLDLSGFDTSNVTNMYYMFSYCGFNANNFTLGLSSFDTTNVIDMSYMFFYCRYKTTTRFSLDLSNFDTSSVTNMSGMFEYCGYSATSYSLNLTSFNTASVTNMRRMFRSCGYNAKSLSLDLSRFNTSNVTDMYFMFCGFGYSVASFSLNLSSFNTEKVTNMEAMFSGCGYSATSFSLDLSNFNTAKVTKMRNMFHYCGYSATSFSLNLTSFNTASVTNMAGMFQYCGYSATSFSLDLSNFNTASVTAMYYMFLYCGYSATSFSLDLSSFNTASVTEIGSMFSYCGYSATSFSLDLSSFDTSSVTSMSSMFEYCGYSASNFALDLSSFDTSKVTNMSYMFQYCGYSASNFSLDLSSFDTSKVTNMSRMFDNCRYLKTVYVSDKWTTSAVTSSTNMFNGCSALVGGNGTKYSSSYKDKTYARIDGKDGLPGYFTDVADKYRVKLKTGQELNALMKNASSYSTSNRTVQKIVFDYYCDSSGEKTENKVYYVNGTNVISGMTGVDATAGGNGNALIYNAGGTTVYVLSAKEMMMNEDASYMFNYFQAMTTLDSFRNFNISQTTNMSNMFNMCGYYQTSVRFDLSSFDTSKVTDMSYMFNNAGVMAKEIYIDVSSFNTEKVEDMSCLFSYFARNCTSFTIDLSKFNTQNVTTMRSMFNYCAAVATNVEIDLTNFDTSKVSNMQYMFNGFGRGVENFTLDLSSFDTSKVTNMNTMFGYCETLTTVYVSDKWTTAAVTDSNDMFSPCSALVGGNGTTYSDSYIDATYARIDGKDGLPGYFTDVADKYRVKLKTGKELNALMKNASAHTTVNFTVEKIVFDFYRDSSGEKTENKVYYVDGVDVISGMTGVDATAGGNGNALIYNAGGTTVYVLSAKEMMMNEDASYMFSSLRRICSLDSFYNFNTSKTTDMSYMFKCRIESENEKRIDISSFDTSNVVNMSYMFESLNYESGGTTYVNLSNLDATKVEDMSYMFRWVCGDIGCISATINLSGFRTKAVKNMCYMFSTNNKLFGELDMSGFDTSQVVDMTCMFAGCRELTTIYVSDKWTTSAVSDSSAMFSYCSALVGGNGTAYNSSYVDGTYARIDGKDGLPGYFTDIADKTESVSEGESEKVFVAFGSFAVAIFGTVAFVWFYRKKKTGRFVGRMNK